jgi:hypothetical protein
MRPEPVITPERADLIRVGMTRSEVTALLGGPPGDYADDAIITYVRGSVGEDSSGFDRGTNWWGREGVIQVQFSEEGRVESAAFYWAHVMRRANAWGELRGILTWDMKKTRHEWVPGAW